MVSACTYREVKLSPPDVERAFGLLKRFSGDKEEKHILREISWTERKQPSLYRDYYIFVFGL